jgi:hypothetical protein
MLDPDIALQPLALLLRKHPSLEAQVIWADTEDWAAQDDEDMQLDGEEITFYAEGLIAEGYHCAWQVLGDGAPQFLRLFFWQGAMPPLPDDPDLLSSGSTAGQ